MPSINKCEISKSRTKQVNNLRKTKIRPQKHTVRAGIAASFVLVGLILLGIYASVSFNQTLSLISESAVSKPLISPLSLVNGGEIKSFSEPQHQPLPVIETRTSSKPKHIPDTGSFANCQNTDAGETARIKNYVTMDGEDSGIVVVACKSIKFHAQPNSFNGGGIVVGVLSSSGGDGPSKRQSIRSTWASSRKGVLFLVAGPWEDISKEYSEYGDLVWIDEEEVYDGGERSVLTLKTYSFLGITHEVVTKFGYDFTHLFKTDDDSYLNVDALYREIRAKGKNKAPHPHDFFGHCLKSKHYALKVRRGKDYKWAVSYTVYPEPWYPAYCLGAGYGVSKNFLECAVSQGNVANIRFNPLEDVAVGLLAERCAMNINNPTTAKVSTDRFTSRKMKKRPGAGDTRVDDEIRPAACMTGKLLQHRIIDDKDMQDHHMSVLDPHYCFRNGNLKQT